MKTKSDRIFSFGLFVVSILFTLILCLTTSYSVSGVSLPKQTILQHIFSCKRSQFLENILYSAPYISGVVSGNQWIIILFPLLVSMPFLLQFSDEFESGFYRMKLTRSTFSNYWNLAFIKNGLLGAASVTLGYLVYVLISYIFFPHINDYPSELKIQLSSPMNQLFNSESDILFVLNQVMVIFMFAFFTAQLCMTLFLVMSNRYKAIGLPMIVFYLLEQISSSLFKSNNWDGRFYIISPKNIVFYTQYSFECHGMSYWYYFLFAFTITAFLYVICKKICRRKVMN